MANEMTNQDQGEVQRISIRPNTQIADNLPAHSRQNFQSQTS